MLRLPSEVKNLVFILLIEGSFSISLIFIFKVGERMVTA